MKYNVAGLIILTGVFFFVNSCSDLPCRDKLGTPTTQIALYRNNGSQIDTIKAYIEGVYANNNEYIKQSTPLKGSNMLRVSLDPNSDFTAFKIIIDSLKVEFIDTISVDTFSLKRDTFKYPPPDTINTDQFFLSIDTATLNFESLDNVDSLLAEIDNSLYPLIDTFVVDIDTTFRTIQAAITNDSVFLKNVVEDFSINHTNEKDLYSVECGFTIKYTINSVDNFNYIRSVIIANAEVQLENVENTDDEEKIHIEFYF